MRTVLVALIVVLALAGLIPCSVWMARGMGLDSLPVPRRSVLIGGFVGALAMLLLAVALVASSGSSTERLTFASARAAGARVPVLIDRQGQAFSTTPKVAAQMYFGVPYICQVHNTGSLGLASIASCKLADS